MENSIGIDDALTSPNIVKVQPAPTESSIGCKTPTPRAPARQRVRLAATLARPVSPGWRSTLRVTNVCRLGIIKVSRIIFLGYRGVVRGPQGAPKNLGTNVLVARLLVRVTYSEQAGVGHAPNKGQDYGHGQVNLLFYCPPDSDCGTNSTTKEIPDAPYPSALKREPRKLITRELVYGDFHLLCSNLVIVV